MKTAYTTLLILAVIGCRVQGSSPSSSTPTRQEKGASFIQDVGSWERAAHAAYAAGRPLPPPESLPEAAYNRWQGACGEAMVFAIMDLSLTDPSSVLEVIRSQTRPELEELRIQCARAGYDSNEVAVFVDFNHERQLPAIEEWIRKEAEYHASREEDD